VTFGAPRRNNARLGLRVTAFAGTTLKIVLPR
jgi:hypothetical protein